MDRLASIIGLAPSELPFPDWITNLQNERDRVSYELRIFRENRDKPGKTKKAKSKKARKKSKTSILTEIEDKGYSIQEILEMMEKRRPSQMKTPRERYQNDAQFHTLVEFMVHQIEVCNYTPSELREAALLASIIHAEIYVRPHIIPLGKDIDDFLEGRVKA